MRNFEFGSTVRSLVVLTKGRFTHPLNEDSKSPLGRFTHPLNEYSKSCRWRDCLYLGDNTVEFSNGQTLKFNSDHLIKKIIKLPNREKSLDEFVNANWDNLKSVISDSVKVFFPKIVIEFDDKEKIITFERYSIAGSIVDEESFNSFTETPVWELGCENYSHGDRETPPDAFIDTLSYNKNEYGIAKKFLNVIWEEKVENYWENVFYSKMAQDCVF